MPKSIILDMSNSDIGKTWWYASVEILINIEKDPAMALISIALPSEIRMLEN